MQTMQAGVNRHKKTVHFERRDTSGLYTGIPVWRLLAYSDDAEYAFHGQDKSIRSYNDDAAAALRPADSIPLSFTRAVR